MPVFRVEVVLTVVVERKKLLATENLSARARSQVTMAWTPFPGTPAFPVEEDASRMVAREEVETSLVEL